MVKDQCPGVVLTFTPHPLEILRKETPFFCLTSEQQRVDLFNKLEVENLILHKIDTAFLNLSARQFIEEILVKTLKAKHVVIGDDFSFGKNKTGNIEVLRELGEEYDYDTHVVSPVIVDGHRCSSTEIRACLQKGNLSAVRDMLGRHFSVVGKVIQGDNMGKALGYKTANIKPGPGFNMSRGVYATVTRVLEPRGVCDYVSATNVGVRPTISDGKDVLIESHCLKQELILYGEKIEVFFIEKIRDEQKFADFEMLQKQIKMDCEQISQMVRDDPSRFNVK